MQSSEFQTDCIDGGIKGVMFNPALEHQGPVGGMNPGVGEAQHMGGQPAGHQPNQHQPPQANHQDKSPLPHFSYNPCYNPNMIQKNHQQQPTSNGIEHCSDKSYMPRFDVSQPFTYNYALVNQMSLAAAASTAAFKCDVCGLVFGHISLLNNHKRMHINEDITETDLYSCEVCSVSFNNLSELKNHKETVHVCKFKPNPPVNEMNCDKDLKKKKLPKCKNCHTPNNKMYENTQDASTCTDDIDTNIRGHYPVKRKKAATVTKCEKCNGTGIIFVGTTEPDIEKPFHCNICDSSFARYSSLWSHRRLHSGDKPFKCDLCGVTFARAAYLKNHNKVHTGERPFKCAVCGMQFTQSAHLKNHERIHSGERPYECDFCGKNFARHSTLWNHRRIHTGEKPYECEICGTCFNQASHLRNHAKVHTGEKPHKCDICDVGFSDKFALKRHRGIHEKYGQTGPNQPAQLSNNSNSNQDDWKPSQQPSQTSQSSQMDNNMYKANVTPPISSFSDCSGPAENK